MEIVNLHSRDTWARAAASGALASLVRRVSGKEAARALLQHAFTHYNGANGKLTSSEDKMAVLNVSSFVHSPPRVVELMNDFKTHDSDLIHSKRQGVGVLRSLAVSPSERAGLFEEVVSHTSRVLDSETHEKTLCVALEVLQSWLETLDVVELDKVYQIYKVMRVED